jgi:lichenan operon transcriptional antiterminator
VELLNEKQKEILLFLEKNSGKWVTSKELASFCQCTTRTIRNRVAAINEIIPQAILASNQGYQRNKQVLLVDDAEKAKERKSRIFLELLKNSSSGINIYDLAESLFVSESTLKNDIQQLKKEMPNQNICLLFEHDYIKLTGSERSKRQYMVSLLYAESDLQEKLKQSIQEMIGYISLGELQRTIQETLLDFNRSINQYALNNIVLHYAISIERIRQGHILKQNDTLKKVAAQPEYRIAETIAIKLAEAYQIQFSPAELEQLSLLFIGLQNEATSNNQNKHLTQFVDETILQVLEYVVKKVEKTYFIDLSNQEFFNKLAIHVQNLYYRSHYESFTRNGSLLDLKTGYPLIYDMSVYISSLIQEQLGIWFNDDEISFIALHIGSFLEGQKKQGAEVTILLLVKEYHDLSKNLQQKLQQHLGSNVKIQIADSGDLSTYTYDLLLTTDRTIAAAHSGSVFIHPFLTTKELRKIENRIYALKLQQQKHQMYVQIDQFITPELYFNQIDPASVTPQLLREQMIQKMEAERFVPADFSRSVDKREQMSPTSFPAGIAVPHAVERNALKSGVAIMTLQEPILWADYPVKLVALVAINSADAQNFNAFFEKFIEIVSDPVNTKQLSMSEDYEEFILRLKQLVDTDI